MGEVVRVHWFLKRYSTKICYFKSCNNKAKFGIWGGGWGMSSCGKHLAKIIEQKVR